MPTLSINPEALGAATCFLAIGFSIALCFIGAAIASRIKYGEQKSKQACSCRDKEAETMWEQFKLEVEPKNDRKENSEIQQ